MPVTGHYGCVASLLIADIVRCLRDVWGLGQIRRKVRVNGVPTVPALITLALCGGPSHMLPTGLKLWGTTISLLSIAVQYRRFTFFFAHFDLLLSDGCVTSHERSRLPLGTIHMPPSAPHHLPCLHRLAASRYVLARRMSKRKTPLRTPKRIRHDEHLVSKHCPGSKLRSFNQASSRKHARNKPHKARRTETLTHIMLHYHVPPRIYPQDITKYVPRPRCTK
jgi:hypothetical protein